MFSLSQSVVKMKIILTSSTWRNTRIKFLPASFWRFCSLQPLSRSSASRYGYLETSSSPNGVLQQKYFIASLIITIINQYLIMLDTSLFSPLYGRSAILFVVKLPYLPGCFTVFITLLSGILAYSNALEIFSWRLHSIRLLY